MPTSRGPAVSRGISHAAAALLCVAGDKARIVERTNDAAPRLLTTPEEMVQAANGVVEIGRQTDESDGSAAFSISAFSDPGLAELRKALPDAAVMGIGEEAFPEAARDGRAFAIVTITPDPALPDRRH